MSDCSACSFGDLGELFALHFDIGLEAINSLLCLLGGLVDEVEERRNLIGERGGPGRSRMISYHMHNLPGQPQGPYGYAGISEGDAGRQYEEIAQRMRRMETCTGFPYYAHKL